MGRLGIYSISAGPGVPNWAWHEYGNRVGFWRMLEVFDDFRIPAVLAYIMGAPHRLKYLRNALAHINQHQDVLFWTGEQIIDWYLAQRR